MCGSHTYRVGVAKVGLGLVSLSPIFSIVVHMQGKADSLGKGGSAVFPPFWGQHSLTRSGWWRCLWGTSNSYTDAIHLHLQHPIRCNAAAATENENIGIDARQRRVRPPRQGGVNATSVGKWEDATVGNRPKKHTKYGSTFVHLEHSRMRQQWKSSNPQIVLCRGAW
jgi:hypothetical protein